MRPILTLAFSVLALGSLAFTSEAQSRESQRQGQSQRRVEPAAQLPLHGHVSPVVIEAVLAATAAVPGMDAAFLMAVASRESGLNPRAQNRGSSAGGLFQFVDRTWGVAVNRHAERHGYVVRDALRMRHDPRLNAIMAAEMLRGERADLEAALGRRVNSIDLFMTHRWGAGGAVTFLRNSGPGSRAYQFIANDLRQRHTRYAGVLALHAESRTGEFVQVSNPNPER